MTRYLIVPGWAGSGPEHWQSHWERALPSAARVEMPDWFAPRRADWVAAIDRAVHAASEPPILVAHSLGCVAIVHWATAATSPIRGALVVAPADVERDGCPPALADFAPLPRATLPFPSRVVASDDDPYASLARVRQFARAWGSALTVLPGAQHINVQSGHGAWPEGRALLRAFEAYAPAAARAR